MTPRDTSADPAFGTVSSPLGADSAQATTQHASDAQGALLLDIMTTIDGRIFELVGKRGAITLDVRDGRLDGWVRCSDVVRHLDAEDALGMTDGRVHSVALSVDEAGTHLFADGYEAFSATSTVWLADLDLTSVAIDPLGIMTVQNAQLVGHALSPLEILARSVAQSPLIEFAASSLSDRDARRCGALTEGALRARYRTRGEGQGGVILQATGSQGSLTLRVDSGDLCFEAKQNGTDIAALRAPGHWDDGDWHDVVLVSGRGALDLYADGYQVLHEAGTAFLSDLGHVDRVVVGMDVNGSRLFGEAQTAMIYDAVLSDAQVKRLASVEPLETRALFDTGLAGSRSYRIPSLITLESGVIVAGADQRVSIANDSPNDINFVMRRSLDGGATWEEIRVLLEYPGHGRLGASVIDSVMVQDATTGRVMVLIDQFPGGYGQPNAEVGTGFDSDGHMVLTDSEGAEFHLLDDGSVVDAEGNPSQYRVDDQGNVERSGDPAGNIHLADGVDPAQTLLSARTAYLQMIWSDDDGATWQGPRNLTPQVKQPWMRFFGTSPGNGIQLVHGSRAGRLLVPVYYNHESGPTFSCAVIYSDDHGETWTLGASPNDDRTVYGRVVHSRDLDDDRASLHESALVEASNGLVHVYMRNQHPSGRIAHAVSRDGGESWGEVDFVDQIPEIFSQPNVIRVRADDGADAFVFANASQMLPFRGRGVLRMSLDDGQTWAHNRVLNPRHHVYQSMAQLPDGRLAVLWEREWQGLFLTIMPLSWLTSSRSSES